MRKIKNLEKKKLETRLKILKTQKLSNNFWDQNHFLEEKCKELKES
jgi:hypothetical protein